MSYQQQNVERVDLVTQENKQDALDKRYLRIAFIWAENSYAIRRQVGCIIVKDNMIISDGYNGTPSGFINACENYHQDGVWKEPQSLEELSDKYNSGCEIKTKPYVLHAEANAITKLAKSNNSSIGATLYVTDMPCIECAKLIIQAKIKRVVYCRDYHCTDGVELLKKANIEVKQITINI